MMKQTKTKIIATIMLLTTALYGNIPSLTQNSDTQELATQLYFNSSPKQDRDNSYDPNQLLGLGYGDVIVLPVGRVAQATSGIVRAVAPSVFNGGKRVVSYTDDVMLNTGIRADSYITNTMTPRIQSGASYTGNEIRNIYYEARNWGLQPKNIERGKDFLDGFGAHYPKPSVKPPYVNSHTTGYILKEIIKKTGN